jgi:hypothetical protein
LPRHATTPYLSQIAAFPAQAAEPVPSARFPDQSLKVITKFAEEPPELPAGGHEEDPMAITERDFIR